MTTTDRTIAETITFLTTLAADAARELHEPGARSCIVDGSHYAPSWRAILALGALYDADEDGETVETIGYALDEWESSVSLPGDAFAYWEDGSLFVELPGDDAHGEPIGETTDERARAAADPLGVLYLADEDGDDGEPIVCAGTGDHDGQTVDSCDECAPVGLDDFTRGYVECAVWTSTVGEDAEPMDRTYTVDDIDADARALMRAECADFLKSAGELLDGLDHGQAGHDFWLTRNRAGAGFWDGDYAEPIGSRLTTLAHTFGESDLYVGDDGRVYVSPMTRRLDVHASILRTLQTARNRQEPSGVEWNLYDLAEHIGYTVDETGSALETLGEYGHVGSRYVGGVSKVLYSAMPDAPACRGVYPVPLAELDAMPDLGIGQTDTRKIERLDADGRAIERVWIARTSVEDGEPWPDRVTVERPDARGSWQTVEDWQAR